MKLNPQKFFLFFGLTILTALQYPEWAFASEKDLNYLMRTASVRVSSFDRMDFLQTPQTGTLLENLS